MRLRLIAVIVVGVAVLGTAVHAASGHVEEASCFLCNWCPF